MIVPHQYGLGYKDALCDARDWFKSSHNARFLKDLRVNQKAVLAILEAFVKYNMTLKIERETFLISIYKEGDGYKASRILSDDELFDLKQIIGGGVLNSLKEAL
jgi:hypothetical protein